MFRCVGFSRLNTCCTYPAGAQGRQSRENIVNNMCLSLPVFRYGVLVEIMKKRACFNWGGTSLQLVARPCLGGPWAVIGGPSIERGYRNAFLFAISGNS